jgi:hypothetical protein
MPLDAHPSEFEALEKQLISPEADVRKLPITGPGEKLVKITNKLADLIKLETKFLKERKTQEAKALHGEKSRLMAEYRETLSHLQVNEHLLGEKDSDERKYVKKVTEGLREVLRDHARIILRLKAVTEGIVKSVNEEVRKSKPAVIGYDRTAAFSMPVGAAPAPVSINQMV